ncbi:MAG TPA: prepilin-type N-terminal cleavage/methylation domain-containing protein [Planctomycetota bacterium]|nr:prepilin-type N-terminal cleavage/methylation domain-containing protein [Planctomycetota bacterium]
MGRTERRARGFTLIELLIVIVIISLLAALLLPALMKALCSARQGTASALISQLAQATKAYELDYAVYPPGRGTDSKDLAFYLQKKGAKQMQYFEFNPDMLDQGNIVNPVWGRDGEPPMTWIYYRNNQAAAAKGAAGGRPVSVLGAPILHPSSFDMWCAGCDYRGEPPPPAAAWSVKYE